MTVQVHTLSPVLDVTHIPAVKFLTDTAGTGLQDNPTGYVRAHVVVYDQATYRTEDEGLTLAALVALAPKFVGKPVLERRHEIDPMGPGEEIGVIEQSYVVGTQLHQVHRYWGAAVKLAIREGIEQGYSVSYGPTGKTKTIKQNGRSLWTDAEPLEVTRTYAPVVSGTGLIETLRRRGAQAMADKPKVNEDGTPEAEMEEEALAESMPVEGQFTGTISGTIAAPMSEEEPAAESQDEPQAQAMTMSEAVALRRQVAALQRETIALRQERETERRTVALRQWRNEGRLNGDIPTLLKATEGVSVQALSKLMAHIPAMEPRLPGVQLHDGMRGGDQGDDVTEQPLDTPAQIQRAAIALAARNKTTYEVEYQKLRAARDARVRRAQQ